MTAVDEVEVVVAHNERATLRVGDVFLKVDADQTRTDVEVEAMALAPVRTPEVLSRRPPVLALAVLPGTALGRVVGPCGVARRMQPDHPVERLTSLRGAASDESHRPEEPAMSSRFRCRLGKHTWRSSGRGRYLTYECLVCEKTRDKPPRAALARITSAWRWRRPVRRLN